MKNITFTNRSPSMTVSVKLNILTAVQLCMFAAVIIYSVLMAKDLGNSAERINNACGYMMIVDECDNLLLSMLTECQQILLEGRSELDAGTLTSLRLKRSRLNAGVRSLSEQNYAGSSSGTAEKIIPGISGYYEKINSSLIQPVFNHENPDGPETSGYLYTEYEILRQKLDTFRQTTAEEHRRIVEHNRLQLGKFVLMIIISLSVLCVILAFQTVFIKRSVINKIRETASKLENLSGKEARLDFRFRVRKMDEVGLMCASFNCFMDNLCIMVDEIRSAAGTSDRLGGELGDAIKSGKTVAEEFAGSHAELHSYFTVLENAIRLTDENVEKAMQERLLSQKREQEGSTALKNSMEYINSTVKQILSAISGIEACRQTAETFAENSRKGVNTVMKINGEIDIITASIDRIHGINRLIDEISDRTNLLGINAAIEAARAGNSGKGFRVVAQEIGRLASEAGRNAEIINRDLAEVVCASVNLQKTGKEVLDRFNMIHESGLVLENAMKTVSDELIRNREQSRRLSELVEKADAAAALQSEALKNTLSRMENISVAAEKLDAGYMSVRHGLNRMSEAAERLDSVNVMLSDINRSSTASMASLNRLILGFS